MICREICLVENGGDHFGRTFFHPAGGKLSCVVARIEQRGLKTSRRFSRSKRNKLPCNLMACRELRGDETSSSDGHHIVVVGGGGFSVLAGAVDKLSAELLAGWRGW